MASDSPPGCARSSRRRYKASWCSSASDSRLAAVGSVSARRLERRGTVAKSMALAAAPAAARAQSVLAKAGASNSPTRCTAAAAKVLKSTGATTPAVAAAHAVFAMFLASKLAILCGVESAAIAAKSAGAEISAVAKAQANPDSSRGVNSSIFPTASKATASKSGTASNPETAKARASVESSCAEKSAIVSTAALAMAEYIFGAKIRFLENAAAVTVSSCGPNVAALADTCAEMASKSTSSAVGAASRCASTRFPAPRFCAVAAKADAVEASSRGLKSWIWGAALRATDMKKSGRSTWHLAKAQTVLARACGPKSSKTAFAATASRKAVSSIRKTAKDQQMLAWSCGVNLETSLRDASVETA
mmetsp:Transcript_9349/g.32886  ORF Transcript_9349/g.32886 Transcript_9349/m.32886 type:complete len:362 (-) Transcript_9349:560-1645(-)